MTAPAKDQAEHGWSAAKAEQQASYERKKTADVIWMNGKLVPWASATVHVMTHALHYGSSVFEGMRAYDTPRGPALFRAREHVRRLRDSARIYRMDLPFDEAELVDACRAAVRENGLASAYLRPCRKRSSSGPMTGAMTENGSMVTAR